MKATFLVSIALSLTLLNADEPNQPLSQPTQSESPSQSNALNSPSIVPSVVSEPQQTPAQPQPPKQIQELSNQVLIKIIDDYRKSDLQNVESKIQALLDNEDFWYSILKYQDTQYGYYENTNYLFVANKQIPSLSLYQIKNGKLISVGKSDAIVGSGKGDKKVSGDLTTPIGVYELKNKLTKLDQYYGPMAFVTSYPNAYDRSLKRTGYGIWIHGMPLDGNRDEKNTKGCIAIENDEIGKYDKLIKYHNTLLLTYDGNYNEPTKEELAIILAQLHQWKDAWEKGDFNPYFAFYSQDFKKPDGTGYQAYKKYKQKIFGKNEVKQIRISKFDITPYPNEENKKIFRVTFNQDYSAFDGKRLTYKSNDRKELYLTIVDGKIKILLEE